MIKFFRKIRQKILTENKFSKYLIYAIGEIALVMIGILLALQVNTWNETRKTNREELELLVSLQNEFTFNRDELDRSIKRAQIIQSRCITLLENTGNREMKLSRYESDSLIRQGLLAIITYDASNGILDNIINSGKIHILKNESLITILSNWGGLLNDVKEDQTWAVNERNTITYPFIYKNSNYVNISRSSIKNNDITTGFTMDYKDIYKLQEFENLVNSNRIWNMKNERNYKNLKIKIEEIILLCEQEIKLKK
ncbi:MAG: DUF6090 family protein [Maribacter arcticus]|jgi:hypothetical protein|uniref:DUF6090 family protein n=1 Tax=Maribacter arcticus TaxID=561365 RepID=UPI003000FBB6